MSIHQVSLWRARGCCCITGTAAAGAAVMQVDDKKLIN